MNLKLSNQAVGCVMMALQKGLVEGMDITDILLGFEMSILPDGNLVVTNPPTFTIEGLEDEVAEPVSAEEGEDAKV